MTGKQSGGVLDAVDAGVEHVIQCVLGEAVRGDPGTFIVGSGNRVPHHGRGERRRQVAGVAVDPVAHELDPAIAVARLLADSFH